MIIRSAVLLAPCIYNVFAIAYVHTLFPSFPAFIVFAVVLAHVLRPIQNHPLIPSPHPLSQPLQDDL